MNALRPLATAIVLLVLGVASLRSPTSLWAGLAWSFASAWLLAAVIRAAVGRGEARAWWLGFAVVGGTYFVLTYDHPPLEFIEGYLPTTRILDEIYLASHPEPVGAAANVPVDAWDLHGHKPGQQAASTYYNINQIQFRWTWHSLLVVVFGSAGGVAGVRLTRARDLPAPPTRRVERRSILSLMAAILASAAAFAALHAPTGPTTNLTFGLLAASLAWAGLEVAFSRGRRRAFWAGYALFGWTYLLAAFGQFEVRLLVYGNAPAEAYLPTSRLLGELFPLLHPDPPSAIGMLDIWNPSYHRHDRLAPPYWHALSRHYFIQIGHSLFGVMAGLLGGVIGAIGSRQPGDDGDR